MGHDIIYYEYIIVINSTGVKRGSEELSHKKKKTSSKGASSPVIFACNVTLRSRALYSWGRRTEHHSAHLDDTFYISIYFL